MIKLGLPKSPGGAAAALAVLVAILLGPFSHFAMARVVNLGTISKGQLQSACSAAGGNYTEGGGSYICTTNCSAKSHCQVACDKSGCKGYTPPNKSAGRGSGTVGGVLSGSAGAASATGGTGTKNKPPLHNVNQPVVVQHSGGARSGGGRH